MESIIQALKTMRIPVIIDEYELQNMIAESLLKHGIRFEREYRLAPRERIDFLAEGGIGIEVKKRKPNRMQVYQQLGRYAASNEITALILVIERSLELPAKINGKPCVSVGLNKLWGVAL